MMIPMSTQNHMSSLQLITLRLLMKFTDILILQLTTIPNQYTTLSHMFMKIQTIFMCLDTLIQRSLLTNIIFKPLMMLIVLIMFLFHLTSLLSLMILSQSTTSTMRLSTPALITIHPQLNIMI